MFSSLKNWWKEYQSDRRWKKRVRKNRARHPDLLQLERDGCNSVIVAQRMLLRDRIKLHDEGVEPDDPRYPDLDHYYIMPEFKMRRQPSHVFVRLWRLILLGSLQ